jgi:nitric oxide reductase large subunit
VATGGTTAVHHRSALWLAFMVLLVLPMVLVGLKAFLDHYQRCIMREKNVRSAFVALSLVMVVLVAFELLVNGTFPSALLASPLAVVMAYGLLRPRREFLAELAFLGLVAGTAWMRWGG